MKDRAEILARTLSKICNLLITSRVFYNACKFSKLKPIFKKGKKTDPSNYRPIWSLLLISEVLERIIKDKRNALLKENLENLLYINLD